MHPHPDSAGLDIGTAGAVSWGSMGRDKDDLYQRALDEPRVTLSDLADMLGISRHALARYRTLTPSRQDMPAWVARELAAFLHRHADRLHEIADEMENRLE